MDRKDSAEIESVAAYRHTSILLVFPTLRYVGLWLHIRISLQMHLGLGLAKLTPTILMAYL